VVSLALVNSLHHWLEIKRFSNILDFSTSIRILEFVPWMGWDSRPYAHITQVQVAWIGSWLYTWLFWLDGCDHTWVFYMFLLIVWLHLCHRSFMFIFWMVAPMCYARVFPFTMYSCIKDISCTCVCRFFMMVFCFSYGFIKHFTPPTLSAFML